MLQLQRKSPDAKTRVRTCQNMSEPMDFDFRCVYSTYCFLWQFYIRRVNSHFDSIRLNWTLGWYWASAHERGHSSDHAGHDLAGSGLRLTVQRNSAIRKTSTQQAVKVNTHPQCFGFRHFPCQSMMWCADAAMVDQFDQLAWTAHCLHAYWYNGCGCSAADT